MTDENLKQAAKVNPEDKFSLAFNNLLETLFIERMDQHEEIFARYMNEPAFQNIVAHWPAGEVYRRLGGFVGRPIEYPPPRKPGSAGVKDSKKRR